MNTSDMNLKEFTNIMNTSYGKRALRVGLMGGEPFLNKEIFDFIADLGLRRKVSNVVSNATPLKGEMLERLIKSSIDVVGLSLYENNFDDVARVVSALNRSNKSYWVQTVAERQDLLMLEKRIKFCREIKCRNLIISNYNSFFDKKHEAVIFDDDLEYIKWEKHFLKEQIHPMNIQWPKKIKRTNPISKDCKMLLSYMHIDNKGLIGPCCFRYPEKKYGNIFVKDSWNGEELVRLRMKMMDKVSSPCEICLGCENLSDDLYGL